MRMRNCATTNLAYSERISFAVGPLAHHGSLRSFSRDHRKRHQRDVGHLLLKLRHRARHVIGRRHHDQRGEAAILHPAPRLDRVADGVDRRIVEIDAARHQPLVARRDAGDLGRCRRAMHAADEQALAAPGGEQLDRVRDARGAAGQHHDAVGVAVERDFLARHMPDEPHEAAACDQRGGRTSHKQQTRASPAQSASGRPARWVASVRRSDHAHIPARIIAPNALARRFAVLPHSIAFRVRWTVRREVPAVTAATSITRPIIAP